MVKMMIITAARISFIYMHAGRKALHDIVEARYYVVELEM